MNILFIVPYVPNPVHVRSYHLIRSLALRGHFITLATLATEDQETVEIEQLRPYCQRILYYKLPIWRSFYNTVVTLPSPRPLQASYCWQPDLARAIKNLIKECQDHQKFDIIHVEHLRGIRYGLYLKSILKEYNFDVPIVWDSVDSITHLFRQASTQSRKIASRWLTRFELSRTEYYEGWLSNQFNAMLVTSQVDKEAFLSLKHSNNHVSPIFVVPNGVDLDYFTPGRQPRLADTMVISGKMSYHANVTMTLFLVNEIMPLIWMRLPEVKLLIVGKNPPREILAFSKKPTIQVTGTVEDIRPYLQKSTVAVTPIRYGAGIQNKVLEAMATETPVVSTSQGISAITAQPGRDLLVADEPNSFAENVIQLLNYPKKQKQIGKAGRQFVESNHRWDYIASQLESIYQDVMSARKKRVSKTREFSWQ